MHYRKLLENYITHCSRKKPPIASIFKLPTFLFQSNCENQETSKSKHIFFFFSNRNEKFTSLRPCSFNPKPVLIMFKPAPCFLIVCTFRLKLYCNRNPAIFSKQTCSIKTIRAKTLFVMFLWGLLKSAFSKSPCITVELKQVQ